MGQLDQFVKQIFADETETVTGGAAAWEGPQELNLSEVRLDGLLSVRDAARLTSLPAPWSFAAKHDEIVFESKMQGDHHGMPAVQRALLRRQARQVLRAEHPKSPWDGEEPLWIVASHVPVALRRVRDVVRIAPGCYRVDPASFYFLWVAANELPLAEELIPFLVARSGRALDEFCLWVKTRRPPPWLLRMVEFLPMSTAIHEDLLRYVTAGSEDPDVRARQRSILKFFVDMTPEVRDEVISEGEVKEARSALRRVLAHRKLGLRAEDEARIAACTDLATLERWHEQAMDAATTEEALQ